MDKVNDTLNKLTGECVNDAEDTLNTSLTSNTNVRFMILDWHLSVF